MIDEITRCNKVLIKLKIWNGNFSVVNRSFLFSLFILCLCNFFISDKPTLMLLGKSVFQNCHFF